MKEEWFPLVDESGNVIGQATRKECHGGSMLLHLVVHLHVFNSKGDLFLQKRAMTKDVQPGKWDTSVGGHIDLNEEIEQALQREVREELAIVDFSFDYCYRYIWKSAVERELVYTFLTNYDGIIIADKSELDDGRFWSISEIKESIGTGIFTPNFEKEFALLTEFRIVK